MLFLLHLAHKMRAPEDGGGRVGIVMNGSPLFSGPAESGPSNIRRWLMENDLVEAIVALPTNMFFNAPLATYIWILDNTKHPDRKGLVQLIDGTSFWTKMRKNLGSKGREISDADRAKVVRLYADFIDADPDYSKVLRNDEFGYWTITVERPLLEESGQPVVDRKGHAQARCQEARHRERPVHLRWLKYRPSRQCRGHQRVLRRRGEAPRPRRLDRLDQGQDRLPLCQAVVRHLPLSNH
jgi:type I restriction enzyme M protein